MTTLWLVRTRHHSTCGFLPLSVVRSAEEAEIIVGTCRHRGDADDEYYLIRVKTPPEGADHADE